MAYMEFEQNGGMKLIQQVLRTPQAAVGQKILEVSELVYRLGVKYRISGYFGQHLIGCFFM